MSEIDVAEAISTLTPADWVRLHKIAKKYARPSISETDLLQEAFTRALEGSRKCPAEIGVVKFLAGVMRSVANGEQQKVERRPRLVSIDADNETGVLDCPDSEPTAEAALVSAETVARWRKQLLDLFGDDVVARDIVDGIIEELSAEELLELSGLDKTAYASKRRLIRRRIEKNYPEGLRR